MGKRRLSQQQLARIKNRQSDQQQQFAEKEIDPKATLAGLVITRFGASVLVETETGELIPCHQRQNLGHVVAGDNILWQLVGEKEGVVVNILPRQSFLTRPTMNHPNKPIAANVDQMFIVVAPEPEPSPHLIDRYLIAAELFQLKPLLIFNKIDQDLTPQLKQLQLLYEALGYPVFLISATQELGLAQLSEQFSDHTNIVVGQSGVGKSSIVNSMLPDLDLKTAAVSELTGLGKHTTTGATLYHLPKGGDLIDSPGVRNFRLGNATRREIEQGFPEIRPFIGQCKFRDCSHHQEPDCAIQKGLAAKQIHPLRLDSFLRIINEL